MTEKRFTIHKESKYKEEWYAYPFCIKEEGEVVLETIPLSIAEKVRDKLNEQQDTIITLKRRLEKINGGYGHLTHRNGLTANEWVIERQEKELKKKNEQISDWIEQHSKDIVKIGEQQTTLSRLEEENEQLKKEYKIAIDEMVTDYKKLEKENEQLQKELEKVKLLNESLGLLRMNDKRYYYNIFDDGTEYIEDCWENKHYFNLDDVEELLNKQQSIIERLEQRDYYNQSERYKILGRAIELASDYIHTNNLEYYDFCGLVTEFEEELLEGNEELQ